MDCVQVVESLSQREKNSILHVLQRDEKLRVGQEKKISLLKQEIQEIRVKSILKAGDDQNKMCIRCRCEFGFLFNRGAICPVCRFKICKLCQEVMFNGSWLCKFCYKQRQLKWLSGEWSASYEENPMRKWASGSDLVKGSFQLFTGASSQDIDIDELPSQTSNNNHSKQSARHARNGHLNLQDSDTSKQRVEYPKDTDQGRLTHLFDVLRTNRPERESPTELQVKRVSSRRYSESDSESSSSSDREDSTRSSPQAPSVTESELDARGDSPRKLSSVSEERDDNTDINKGARPRAAPRSPKPAQRHVTNDTQIIPKPKPKEKRKNVSSAPNVSQESRLKSEHFSQVSASRSVDNILGHNLLAEKDGRGKKAVSHTELHTESAGRELGVSSLESLRGTAHKSSEHLGPNIHVADKINTDVRVRRSADNLNTHVKTDQHVHENYELLGAKVRQDIDAEHRRNQEWLSSSHTDGDKSQPKAVKRKHEISHEAKQPCKDKDEDFELHVPRSGSPYSCSMDSIPSSNASPTPVHSVCDSSLAESSDTDSLSRQSHGELSGTESVQREGSEEDYVVEEISKVRFQRVSRKVAQVVMAGKVSRSPRKHSSSDGLEVHVGQRKTQSREVAGANEEGGGSKCNSQRVAMVPSTPPSLPNPTEDCVFPLQATKTNKCPRNKNQMDQLKNYSVNTDININAANITPTSELRETLKPTDISLLRLNSNMSNRSADELSWYDEYGENNQIVLGDTDTGQSFENFRQRQLPGDKQRIESDADSIEGMIDNMAESQFYVENVIHSARVSEADSEGGFSIPPLSPAAYEVKAGTYTITYMSDDNLDTYTTDENLDASSAESELDETLLGQSMNDDNESDNLVKSDVFRKETVSDEREKRKLKAMDSLDLLVMQQGNIVDASMTSVELESEFETALQISGQRTELSSEAAEISLIGKHKAKHSEAKTLDSLFDKKNKTFYLHQSDGEKAEESLLTSTVRHQTDEIPIQCDDGNMKNESNTEYSTASAREHDMIKHSEVRFDKSDEHSARKSRLSAMKSLDLLVYEQGDLIDPNTENVDLDFELQSALCEQGIVGKAVDVQPSFEMHTTKTEKGSDEAKTSRSNTLDVVLDKQSNIIDYTCNIDLKPNGGNFNSAVADNVMPGNVSTQASGDSLDNTITEDIESPIGKSSRPKQHVEHSIAKCIDSLHNKLDITAKLAEGRSEDKMDFPVTEIGIAQHTPQKTKLSAMNSLDLLVHNQGNIIDHDLDNVELDVELQNALKDQHEMNRAMSEGSPDCDSEYQSQNSLTGRKLRRMNTLDILLDKQGHIISSSCDEKPSNENDKNLTPEVKTTDKIEPIEGKSNVSGTAGLKTQYVDHSGVKHVDIVVNEPGVTYSDIEVKKHCPVDEKNKLTAMDSLDILVIDQGDKVDTNIGRIELDMEVRAADEVLGSTDGHNTDVKQIKQPFIGYVEQQESDDSDILSVIEEVEEVSDSSDQVDCAQDIRHLESQRKRVGVVKAVSKHKNNVENISNKPENEKQHNTSEKKTNVIIEPSDTSRTANNESDSDMSEKSMSSRVKAIEQKVKHIVSGNDTPSPGHAVYKGYDVKIHSKFKKLQNLWTAVEKHEANILDIDDSDEQGDRNDSTTKSEQHYSIASNSEIGKTDSSDTSIPVKSHIKAHLVDRNDFADFSEDAKSEDAVSVHGCTIISSSPVTVESKHEVESVYSNSELMHEYDEGTAATSKPLPTLSILLSSPVSTDADPIGDIFSDAVVDESNFCQSITDRHMTSSLMGESHICHSIRDMSSKMVDNSENISVTARHTSTTSTTSTSDTDSRCHSIGEGESDATLYYVHEDIKICHSIDEMPIYLDSALKDQPQAATTDFINNKSKETFNIQPPEDREKYTKYGHKVLKRLSLEKQEQGFQNISVQNTIDMKQTDSMVNFSNADSLTSGPQTLPPQGSDQSECFKAPTLPHLTRRRSSSSSVPSSPELGHEHPFPSLDSPISEKLSSRSSPPTISESSVSQDDSGHVSGGSWGNTPEHRRTDSGYSQSSLPSTLSTVTDKSDDEDIDRMFASAPRSNRGNLLSVVSDSRESLASYYSDAGDIAYSKIPVSGEILFGLNYNYKTGMLEVAVKQCRNIAAVDVKRKRSDPYVKTYLLPDRTRSGKRKSKVKKHTLDPTFDETLKYVISKSELENRTLWVTVWHNDRFGRNDFLGEVTINFDYYKFDEPFPKWYPLQERLEAPATSMMTYNGDLSLCVLYVPPEKLGSSPNKGRGRRDLGKGQLHVTVKQARNLTAVRSNGFSDPFCKGYLLPERHRSSKQKTPVIKKDCSPTWDHTFIFEDVSLMELRERCLELTIWDYEKLSSNDFLGGTRLNLGTGLSQGKPVDWMDARGEEMSTWQAMLDRPNVTIDGALILRPNMDKRKF